MMDYMGGKMPWMMADAAAPRRLLSRRALLRGATGLLASTMPSFSRAEPAKAYSLLAHPARRPLVGAPHPETDVWAYNGTVPGPEIRLRQGERLRVVVENRLAEGTTVHWHGVRVPNAMDGVPELTQAPIEPNGTFVYEFDLPDAGTYWYHPHQRSFEQVGRGLSGALIVEEREPIAVARDLVWVLDDWRLKPDGSISGDFGNMFDVSHNGRVGNTVSVNGRVPTAFTVRAGERIRLRLINVANARIFGLEFRGHSPQIVALDGQPVEPHIPEGGRIILGPAMRADLVIDMAGEPRAVTEVVDSFYPRLAYKLLDIAYTADLPIRRRLPDVSITLPANTMPEPDLKQAQRHDITFTGGMMGGMMGATMDGRRMDMREMMQHGKAWAINGVAASGHIHAPLLTLERGRSYILALRNETAWHHPMHLHGHAFRVIARNGQPTARREWQDTVLIAPRESADIAFVADNPGDWMFHCHILEHQAGGMMGSIRVS
jgi:FtsP/CotA-like multicopper oxidase with cupredoxin domain